MSTEKAKNIMNVPENVTVTENPAPTKIEMPKITAKRDLAVPTEKSIPSTPTPSISFDTLLSMGIVEKNKSGKYNATADAKAAREYLRKANPNLAAKVDSDSLAVLLASVGQNTEAVQRAGKKVALAMALVDINETYKQYAYKNTSSLFRALYPTLADSTIWNYINTGKEIYLPAQSENAPEYLKELAELEPGTALFAVGVLRDENASKRFPKEIAKEKKERKSGRITQSILKAAAKAARNPEKAKKEDGTAGTDKKDAKASAEMEKNAWKALVRRGMTIESKGNERYIYIYENLMQSAKELLKAASRDEKSALEFVDALIDALNI